MPDSICAAIIGKGRVATTLGRAWESSGLSIGAFCNRSHEIPDGFTTLDALCVEDCSQLPSDINVAMIAVSDDAVPAIIDQLPSGIFSILGCCPSDAAQDVFSACNHVSEIPGGKGCVRELIEAFMKAKGLWDGEGQIHW